MTNQQLIDIITKLEKENTDLDSRVEGFKSGGIELISEEQLNEAAQEGIYYAQNWKKLKRGCKEMMEMISESADMNIKDFIKNLGLELDEDYGVDLTKMRLA